MQIQLRQNAMGVYCKRVDISRDELSRRMSVASSTTYRVDAGLAAPSPKFIAALMQETGLAFEDLFEIVEAEPAGSAA